MKFIKLHVTKKFNYICYITCARENTLHLV